MLISFFVHGEPQPAGSKRAFIVKRKDGKLRAAVTDDNPRSKPWQAMVADAAREWCDDHYLYSPLEGPVCVVFTFFRVQPKSHFRKDGSPSSAWQPFPIGRPDALKLARGTEDALTGVIWRDDAQVVGGSQYKLWGERPGVHIEIETIGGS